MLITRFCNASNLWYRWNHGSWLYEYFYIFNEQFEFFSQTLYWSCRNNAVEFMQTEVRSVTQIRLLRVNTLQLRLLPQSRSKSTAGSASGEPKRPGGQNYWFWIPLNLASDRSYLSYFKRICISNRLILLFNMQVQYTGTRKGHCKSNISVTTF